MASLLTSTALGGATGAHAASLMESVRLSLQTNPEIGVVKADRHAVDMELRQARAGYLPQVDLRGAVGPEYSDNPSTRSRAFTDGDGSQTLFRKEAQLSLSQMLFDGFATSSEVERQRARVDSAAYRVNEAAEFIGLNAIEAHLDVLRNATIVELNERNIEQHERILGQVGELERNGRGDIADVRQAESRVARARENLAISRGNYADSLATYQRVVGTAPGELDEADAPVAAIPPGPDDAATLASVNSPTVLIAAADADVAAAELRGARSGFYPRFDLEMGAFAGEDIDGVEGNNVDASALLVMRYNVFRGGADMALEREAFHRVNESRANLARARRTAEEEARISYNALITARARTEALGGKAEAQRRTRDAYASQFEIGQRDLLDVLDSENELFLDRVNLVTAELTEQFAVYRVLAVIGQLLDTLDVARPREHISIYRSADDVQTPVEVDEKTEMLESPRALPRLLRSPEAGAPPADLPDASEATGRSVPQAALDTPADTSLAMAPEQKSAPAASYESFGSFWRAMVGETAPAGEAPIREAEAVEPATGETVTPAASYASGPVADSGPAEYADFNSFFASVFGDGVDHGEAVSVTATAAEPVAAPAEPEPLSRFDDVRARSFASGAGSPGQPASYDSLDSFLDSVFGSGTAAR
ncbi:MAG: TolC family outer membrane protein [Geminicoccaceae bacterium]|nr:TolC family outer membrane protein [Geminicoccaceae bacterium]